MSCCGQIAKGAVGLAKAALKINPSSVPVYKSRLRICWECPESQPMVSAGVIIIGKKERCGECGCLIKAKAAIQSEQCPLKKW